MEGEHTATSHYWVRQVPVIKNASEMGPRQVQTLVTHCSHQRCSRLTRADETAPIVTGVVQTIPSQHESGAKALSAVTPRHNDDRYLTDYVSNLQQQNAYDGAIAVVLLTQADRPTELARAISSVRSQEGIDAHIVLVVNGATPPEPATTDQLIVLPQNVGIPEGRNVGARAADARLLLFLDDDAELLNPRLLRTVVDRFDADPKLGAMAIRLVDEYGHSQRRHVPRLGSRSAHQSGFVTHFVGAACVVRASAFHEVGGFDPRFFYAMEESDLSWRLLGAGWSIWYSADLKAFHPHTTPTRHQRYAQLTARNRLWMAWRNLPVPLFAGYVAIWTILAVVRGAGWRDVVAGCREAWGARPARQPMRWRTVAYMTRLGRPPVI